MRNQLAKVLAFFLLLPSTPLMAEKASIISLCRDWIISLKDHQRPQAVFGFGHTDRINWSFVPPDFERNRQRRNTSQGLRLSEMNETQRSFVDQILLQTLGESRALAQRHVRDRELIISPEMISLEDFNPAWYGPDKYHFALFGSPKPEAKWALRFQGHHFSMNLTFDGDQLISATPLAWGEFPTRVITAGPKQTAPFDLPPILQTEEALARTLAASLPRPEKGTLIALPLRLQWEPGRPITALTPDGLKVGNMSPKARQHFLNLLNQIRSGYGNAVGEVLKELFNREPENNLTFLWAGSYKAEKPFYFRVQGTDLKIEFIQINGNHIHMVIHDASKNFGGF